MRFSLSLSFHHTRLLCKKICFSYDNYPVRANYSHVYKGLRARFVYSSHLMCMSHLAIQIGQYKHKTQHTDTHKQKSKQCIPDLSAGLIIMHGNNRIIILYILYNIFTRSAFNSLNFQLSVLFTCCSLFFDWKAQCKSQTVFKAYPMWSLHFLIEM